MAAPVSVRLCRSMREVRRAAERASDAMLLQAHAYVCEFGRQWEHPELVLDDEELEAIEARAFGRTLAEIDELPELMRVS